MREINEAGWRLYSLEEMARLAGMPVGCLIRYVNAGRLKPPRIESEAGRHFYRGHEVKGILAALDPRDMAIETDTQIPTTLPPRAAVQCSVFAKTLESEAGRQVAGCVAVCGKCGHAAESFGQTEASVNHALLSLRETCPNNERNYYQ